VAPGGSGFQTALTGVDTSVLIGAPIVFMIALVASRPLRETVRSLPRRLAGTGRLAVDSLRWVIARVRQALLHSDAPGVTAVP